MESISKAYPIVYHRYECKQESWRWIIIVM